MGNVRDLVIVGAGPAGLAAGIYSGRARMNAILVEKLCPGGQVLVAERIENFPGFPSGVKGPELADYMLKQAKNTGLEVMTAEVTGIELKNKGGGPFSVVFSDGKRVDSHSLIAATGARWNTLGIPGESELSGRGVSYCATCDGPLFRNKDVAVIGGGDTALEDALFLTRFANKVTIVHRRDRLRAAKILQERAFANKRIELCLNSVAVEVAGKGKVDGLKVRDVVTGAEKVLKTDGVFVLIGITPNSEIFKDILKLDEKGYIIADDEMRTSVDGIFACGDVRKKGLRQVVTAVGEGAVAAMSALHYVERLKGTEYK